MIVTFWGTRGSLPAPGPDTVKYGGNTTCIEVNGPGDARLILDAGSGIRPLGLKLAKSMPVKCLLFITHTHWDHIHGLPFFVPLFVPGNEIVVHGPPDPVAMKGIEDVLDIQLAYPHFPVRSVELKAKIRYLTLRESQEIEDSGFKVASLLMNHPALTFGYKVCCNGRTLFFTGDHEPFFNIYSPGEEGFADYEASVRERLKGITDFVSGADLLIADAQYTPEEYGQKVGWGHSSYAHCLNLAARAGVKKVCLTHHEVTRTDRELDALQDRVSGLARDLGVSALFAAEGLSLEI
ncbi:MAG: MBL fold metallo-hydrolase [Desulfovibrionaceae bacterium]|nr:MBL fold metallo-hydrolase [Desulfovibrionaceae bacterium]